MRKWAWALFGLIASSGTVSAQGVAVELGILTCNLAASASDLPSAVDPETAIGPRAGQSREMVCWFRPFEQGPVETYTGTIQGVGQEQRLFDRPVMLWMVKGRPANDKTVLKLPVGSLQQTYAVESARPAGQAPAPLVGEANPIVLQSLSEPERWVVPKNGKPANAANSMVLSVALKLQAAPA